VRGLSWPFNETYKRSFISFTETSGNSFTTACGEHQYQFLSTEPSVHQYQYAGPADRIGGLSEEGSGPPASQIATSSIQGVILNTVVRYTRFDSSTYAQGLANMEITPEGWRGNFFNNWARKANQAEILRPLNCRRNPGTATMT